MFYYSDSQKYDINTFPFLHKAHIFVSMNLVIFYSSEVCFEMSLVHLPLVMGIPSLFGEQSRLIWIRSGKRVGSFGSVQVKELAHLAPRSKCLNISRTKENVQMSYVNHKSRQPLRHIVKCVFKCIFTWINYSVILNALHILGWTRMTRSPHY